MQKTVCVVLGTRPEAIKLAPVIWALEEDSFFQPVVVSTGQHKEMLEPLFPLLDIKPDFELQVMQENQTLASLTSKLTESLDKVFQEISPSALIVQGDTSTTFVGALLGYYSRIPIGHVEAGLRTGQRYNPYPEEMNRRMVTQLATWHFAPTFQAANNLKSEGVDQSSIFITGNTVIDTLQTLKKKERFSPPHFLNNLDIEGKKLVLVTSHRRENFGKPLEQFCNSILELTEKLPDLFIVFPVHLNPNVSKTVNEILGNRDRIFLASPLPYHSFISLMDSSDLILTDSGGVQEEAAALGKPVLVLRSFTDRPESLDSGLAQLLGSDPGLLVAKTTEMLYNLNLKSEEFSQIFGDGNSGKEIITILKEKLL